MCPLCYGEKPREFGRVADFRFHIKNKHPAELTSMPKHILSTRSAFYFSRAPRAFMDAHDVSDFDSEEASYARYLITKWATGRSPGISSWLEGWDLGKTKKPKRKAPKDLLTMVIVNLVLVYDSVKAIMRGNDNEFLVKISREVFKDPRALGSLRRRKDCLEHQPFDDRGNWTRTDDPDILSAVSSALGIRSSYIYSILQRSCILFDAVRLADIRSPTPIQLLPPVSAPASAPDTPSPTPPRAPSPTRLPASSPVPALSPRPTSNKDKKTPADSAPSPSSPHHM